MQEPPNDPDVEKTALGCLLRQPRLFYEATEAHPGWFFRQSHRLIFIAIQNVVSKKEFDQEGVLLAYVDAELTAKGWMEGLGSSTEQARSFLREIFDKPVSPGSQWPLVSAALRDLYLRRALLSRTRDWMVEIRETEEAIDVVRDVLEWSSVATSKSAIDEDESFRPVVDPLLREIENRRDGKEPAEVWETGIGPFDELLDGGVTLGHYTILAAKKKMGKTRLGCATMNSLLSRADDDWAVDFYSGEMTKEDIAKLFVAHHTGWAFHKLADPQININEDWARLAVDAMGHLGDLDIRVKIGRSHVRDILYRTKARRARIGSRPLAVVVDYLQQMKGSGDSEYERVTNVTQQLQTIAKTIPNTWVFALAQFNRSAGSDMPRPHQLRSSGQIEQDVDELFILHRPAAERSDATAEDKRVGILWKALDRHRGDTEKLMIDADLERLQFTL